ncbi:hypothetical protein [Catellatospora sp. NPDC049609]|uniref:hypothetical protein n=1 Tax=Catellatospora sp. NPDC049609 TaxID=3155505 RepID=UPI003414FD34
MPVRDEVVAFCSLGVLPSEQDNDEDGDEAFEELERRLLAIAKPVTDEEAQLLTACFGEDNCFGLSWTLLHLVESAPSAVITTEPVQGANPWHVRLWRRDQNAQAS